MKTLLVLAAIIAVVVVGGLIALRLADWQDTQEDYDEDDKHP